MKTCSRCGKSQPITEFGKNSGMADGYLHQCKTCKRIQLRSYRIENRESVRAYQHSWEQKPEVKERTKIRLAEWKKNNKKKRHAQVVIGNAVRDGKITPQPCFICGEKAHAHHPDYSAPMDVVWLCPPHHMQVHQEK